MATLKELAAYTGYSISTISRILNNDPTMTASEETRHRVLEAAGALNYAATKSRKGRSPKPVLRLGVAEMLDPSAQLDDPYYLYLKNYVAEICAEQKIQLVDLAPSEEGFVPPDHTPVEGVIAIGIFTRRQIDSLHRISDNLVFLDSSPDERRSDSVVINFKVGMQEGLEYLLAAGHRRIGFIGPREKLDDFKQPAPEQRWLLFCELMEARGLLHPSCLIEAPMHAGQTAEAVRQRLQEGIALPTAVITANEQNAIGAIRALREAGLQVPDDLSIISFNDTPLSELTEPPLTSISTHAEEMCRTAVRLACERAPGRAGVPQRTLPQKVIIPPALVPRESVRRVTEG